LRFSLCPTVLTPSVFLCCFLYYRIPQVRRLYCHFDRAKRAEKSAQTPSRIYSSFECQLLSTPLRIETRPFPSKYAGQKQHQCGDNGPRERYSRPSQISCIPRMLLLELIVIIVQIRILPRAQPDLNDNISGYARQKQHAPDDVKYDAHSLREI